MSHIFNGKLRIWYFCLYQLAHTITVSWPHISNWKYFVLVSLKCLLACLTVIWFFGLRCRGNKFSLIEGSCYENLHYCLVLTNRILQKLVIIVMGRSEHATWVITSAPACLMVCYAEQRAAGACWGKDKAKGSDANFFLKLSNLYEENCYHPSNCEGSNNLEEFLFPPMTNEYGM